MRTKISRLPLKCKRRTKRTRTSRCRMRRKRMSLFRRSLRAADPRRKAHQPSELQRPRPHVPRAPQLEEVKSKLIVALKVAKNLRPKRSVVGQLAKLPLLLRHRAAVNLPPARLPSKREKKKPRSSCRCSKKRRKG